MHCRNLAGVPPKHDIDVAFVLTKGNVSHLKKTIEPSGQYWQSAVGKFSGRCYICILELYRIGKYVIDNSEIVLTYSGNLKPQGLK